MNYPVQIRIMLGILFRFLHYDDRTQTLSDLVCRQGNTSCGCRQVVSVASRVYWVTNRGVMAFVTALAIWPDRTIGCTMISRRTIETQSLAKKNLSAIWQVRDLCTVGDLRHMHNTHTYGVSDLHDVYDKFWSGAYFLSMIALVRVSVELLYLLGLFSPTIE